MSDGDQAADAELFDLVYPELHREAQRFMRGEGAGHTLQPTALVNECYLRLVDGERVQWQDRGHFFRVAARAMRNVLVDYARQRNADKRGGGLRPLQVNAADAAFEKEIGQLLALTDALDHLHTIQPGLATVAQLRLFSGLGVKETAQALDKPLRTVERHWREARDWLREQVDDPR
ncbi:MAG: sigma-70 family RNA polymerase sigma factor [bacterium]|nr:sigma-70 family RNA polymerase sigma factor [bacterium]